MSNGIDYFELAKSQAPMDHMPICVCTKHDPSGFVLDYDCGPALRRLKALKPHEATLPDLSDMMKMYGPQHDMTKGCEREIVYRVKRDLFTHKLDGRSLRPDFHRKSVTR